MQVRDGDKISWENAKQGKKELNPQLVTLEITVLPLNYSPYTSGEIRTPDSSLRRRMLLTAELQT